MKKTKHFVWAFLFTATAMVSCAFDIEQLSSDTNLKLTASTDSIIFDTLFSSVGSVTKRFKVYNPHNNAINISRINLESRSQSSYTLTINGQRGVDFRDEVILGKDSLLVLVDVLINPSDSNLPFLVKDDVVFEYNGNTNGIKLVSWGQDAYFINSEIIVCDATWTSDKPYIIYNYALVDTLCSLTIEEGTRIYIDNEASVFIKGSIKINGSAEKKVIIRNIRLDDKYEIAPGQWNGIFFLEGSYDNVVNHADIKNGHIGLRVGNPDDDDDFELIVSNTSIGHMSRAGIEAYGSDIYVYNTEIFDCQAQLVANIAGGNYRYEHCTFSNYPNNFSRNGASVIFTNYLDFPDAPTISADLNLLLTNSIIWGPEEEELLFDISDIAASSINVKSNIIRSAQTDWVQLGNTISLADNYPGFHSPTLIDFDYRIDSLSNARDLAEISLITHDLLGTKRNALPDLGAYEHKDSIP